MDCPIMHPANAASINLQLRVFIMSAYFFNISFCMQPSFAIHVSYENIFNIPRHSVI